MDEVKPALVTAVQEFSYGTLPCELPRENIGPWLMYFHRAGAAVVLWAWGMK